MKVYTKTGDKGQTSLLGGKRVSKADKRLEAYGTIDELNSFMGLFRSKLTDNEHKEFIYQIQKTLFTVGAILATPKDYKGKKIELDNSLIEQLENKIDEISATLPPFKEFIVYGENEISSISHICRAIARRAERHIIDLNNDEVIDNNVMVYVNRLSDLLYMFGLKLA